MFKYPATELFDKDGARRVVWSQEEFDSAIAEGHSLEKPAASAEPAAEPVGDTPLDPSPAPPAEPKKPSKKAK